MALRGKVAVPHCVVGTGAVLSEETVLYLDPFVEAVFCHFEPSVCASATIY